MKKIVLFDFCNTLVNYETADKFVEFSCNEMDIPYMHNRSLVLCLKTISKIVNLFVPFLCIEKRVRLAKLKGISKNEIDILAKKYYEIYIKPNIISEICNRLIEYKKQGYYVLIVSAAYYPYLKFFQEEYDVDYVITNDFKYDAENRFSGEFIEKKDCIGKEKVRRLKDALKKMGTPYSVEYSYGDSKNDIPILSEAKRGIVVIQNKKKIRNKYGFWEVWI